MPHPILLPLNLIANNPNERSKKDVIIPEAVISILLLITTDVLFLGFRIDNNLTDNTGSTQGIKFKIKPPIIAIK